MTNRAITETTTGEHWVAARVQAVVETTTPKTTQGIVTTIHEGSSVIAARAIVTRASIRATYSPGTLSSRADRTAKSYTMPETASTACGARKAERWPLWAPFEWSRHATSGTTMTGPPIRVRVTCVTCVRRRSSEPSG